MAYFLRFLLTDAQPTTLQQLDQALQSISASAALRAETFDDDYADVEVNGIPFAEVSINTAGDGIFEEELEDLREPVEWYSDSAQKTAVLTALTEARAIVCFRLLHDGWDSELIDDACRWLLAHRTGVLHVSGEGFFDANGVILPE
jgi:predicted xylose isomerase-like sugar epimerase